jgi:hypothetical protein
MELSNPWRKKETKKPIHLQNIRKGKKNKQECIQMENVKQYSMNKD